MGRGRRILLALGALFLLAHVWRSSFLLGDERHFLLFDDVMISMRYARNLAVGEGPVWNPGERVEGFSNPLWTAGMALVHLLPLPRRLMALPVQLLGALLLLLAAWRAGCLALRLGGPRAGTWASALTLFHLSLVYWSTQGFEAAALTWLLAESVHREMAHVDGDEGASLAGIYAPMALAVWVRLDAAVPLAALALALGWLQPAARRRHAGAACLALAVSALPLTLLRLAYYGLPVPCTYFLKAEGYWWGYRAFRGALVLGDWLAALGALLLLLALPALRRHGRRALPLLLPFLAQAAYSVWAGGDAWEPYVATNRFLCTGLPLLHVLAALGTDELALRLAVVAPELRRRRSWIAGLVVLVCLVRGNAVREGSLRRTLLLEPPLYRDRGRYNVVRAAQITAITRPGARVAVVWAGTTAYFLDRPCVDLLGRSDPVVARGPARVPPGWEGAREYWPGHSKWDYAYSIGELRPDVVAQVWKADLALEEIFESGEYVQVDLSGMRMLLRKGSAQVRWERVAGSQLPPTS